MPLLRLPASGSAWAGTPSLQKKLSMNYLRNIQFILLVTGVFLIAVFVGAYIHRTLLSKAELKRFQSRQVATRGAAPLVPESGFKVDFSLWSKNRIEEYEQSLMEHFRPPLAVLRIPRLGLEVPVLEGTDDLTLNRGVGHISGTGIPGGQGNIGIAGHRDGFFRVLKDIRQGDTIELTTPTSTDVYKVDLIVLVAPNDVSVLQPRSSPSLTLVTCYPFYFIGNAPQRYIVQASIVGAGGTNGSLFVTALQALRR
jgi:sortase A